MHPTPTAALTQIQKEGARRIAEKYPNSRAKHLKSGKEYGILGVCLGENNLEELVIYADAELCWARNLEEFLARFDPC